jgi:alkylhydroperoxidase family enzyme
LSWRSPQAAGLDEELLASVDGYRTAVGFTPAERVALEYTERFATDSAAIDDGLLTRLSEHFAEGEVVELTLVVAKYLALGKFMQVLGLDQACGLEPDGAGSVSRY